MAGHFRPYLHLRAVPWVASVSGSGIDLSIPRPLKSNKINSETLVLASEESKPAARIIFLGKNLASVFCSPSGGLGQT